MENMLTYDSLTHLRDRVTFFADKKTAAGMGMRAHLVMLQTFALPGINHKYNIQVGDQFLRDMSAFLDSFSPDYKAYRFANARFILLGKECSQSDADSFVKKLHERFEQVWHVKANDKTYDIFLMPQIVHMFLNPDISDNGLTDRLNYGASDKVYLEKAQNDILFFGEELEEALQRKTYVLDEVRYAIEQKTFQIYYQPIYDCRNKVFTSAESLIRLFARDGSFISPGEFIPLAEGSSLIDSISWIVLEKVCDFLGRYKELPLKTVSVNMAGQQILDPTFVSRIEENLEKNHIEGSKLRIEITERTITDDFNKVKNIMQYLSEKGIHFYLDDFGTGYSNLSSMLRLPFEVIKFDMSLMRLMEESKKGSKTIELLSNIMHENSYLIVSEGIETAAQAEQAYKLQMDRIQGFFFSKPLSETQLIDFFDNFDKSSGGVFENGKE